LPLAVQDVAFVLDQVMVELAPEEIVEGLNAMTAVGITVLELTLRTPAQIAPMATNDVINRPTRGSTPYSFTLVEQWPIALRFATRTLHRVDGIALACEYRIDLKRFARAIFSLNRSTCRSKARNRIALDASVLARNRVCGSARHLETAQRQDTSPAAACSHVNLRQKGQAEGFADVCCRR
jgi:hypothetical protein